jgi:hypothetical protein
LHIYADANNFYEALTAANEEAYRAIRDSLPNLENQGKYHIEIYIERFGEQVPKDLYYEIQGRLIQRQEIAAQADADNIFEALAAANFEVLREIQKYEVLPSFGSKESHYRRER